MGIGSLVGSLVKFTLALGLVAGIGVGGAAFAGTHVWDSPEAGDTPTPTPGPTETPRGTTEPPADQYEPLDDDAPDVAVGVPHEWDHDTDPDDPGRSTYDAERERIDAISVEFLIHVEVNERRAEHGLEPLRASRYVSSVSRAHSEDMAARDFFSHVNPDDETPSDRFGKVGTACGTYGENIAYNYVDVQVANERGGESRVLRTNEAVATALVNQWMNSTEHREAILYEEYEYVGTGVYLEPGDYQGSVTEDGGVAVHATQNFCDPAE